MTDQLSDYIGFDNYSVDCQWTQNDKGDYVLCYFINYYNEDEPEVSDKTKDKVSEAINNAMEKHNNNGFENNWAMG